MHNGLNVKHGVSMLLAAHNLVLGELKCMLREAMKTAIPAPLRLFSHNLKAPTE
jgi:hypothetical protein